MILFATWALGLMLVAGSINHADQNTQTHQPSAFVEQANPKLVQVRVIKTTTYKNLGTRSETEVVTK